MAFMSKNKKINEPYGYGRDFAAYGNNYPSKEELIYGNMPAAGDMHEIYKNLCILEMTGNYRTSVFEPSDVARANLDNKKRAIMNTRDSEQLKLIMPDFDYDKAMENQMFADMIRAGATVFEALSKCVKGPEPTAIEAEITPRPQREAIYQNAQSSRRGTGKTTFNPSQLSSADFKKYIDAIRG